jgi:hypothetical protein
MRMPTDDSLFVKQRAFSPDLLAVWIDNAVLRHTVCCLCKKRFCRQHYSIKLGKSAIITKGMPPQKKRPVFAAGKKKMTATGIFCICGAKKRKKQLTSMVGLCIINEHLA